MATQLPDRPTAPPWLLPALLLLLPALAFGAVLTGRVFYWGVYLLQFYPWRLLVVRAYQAGRWPLWTPLLGAGAPLAANLQSAAFYPPNLLFLVMPVERAFGWSVVLHLAWAGLGLYAYARLIGLRPGPAFLAGLSFGLGSYLVTRTVFLSMANAVPWAAWVLFATERLLRHRSRRAVALLALTMAMLLLAGHAQTAFYTLLATTTYALYRAAGERSASALRPLALYGLALLLGLALAAVQLLPTAELTLHSQRTSGLDDTFALEYSFWPWRLITLLTPDFFGHPARDGYHGQGNYWEYAAYVGLFPLFLAGAALHHWWLERRRPSGPTDPLRLVPFFTLLTLAGLYLALGQRSWLYMALYRHVPPFSAFQAPARLLLLWALGLPILAGIGLQQVTAPAVRERFGRPTWEPWLVILGLGVAVGGLGARFVPGLPPRFGNGTLRLGLGLALVGGLILLRHRARHPRPARRWEALALALTAVDLFSVAWNYQPTTDPALYHQLPATVEAVAGEAAGGRLFLVRPRQVYDRYISLTTFGDSAPEALQGLLESLHPNLNAAYGLPGVDNYEPLLVGRYSRLREALTTRPLTETLPLLRRLGVGTLLVPDATGERVRVRQIEAYPRLSLVPTARVIASEEALLAQVLAGAWDPRREVLLAAPPPPPAPNGAPPAEEGDSAQGGPGSLTMLRDEPDLVTIQAVLTAPAYLVLMDTLYPGWEATVDGRPVPILRANYAFRALALEAGEHRIVFRYAPASFRWGLRISGLALLTLVLLALPRPALPPADSLTR